MRLVLMVMTMVIVLVMMAIVMMVVILSGAVGDGRSDDRLTDAGARHRDWPNC